MKTRPKDTKKSGLEISPDDFLGWFDDCEKSIAAGESIDYCGRYVHAIIWSDQKYNIYADVYRNGHFNRQLRSTTVFGAVREILDHFGNE